MTTVFIVNDHALQRVALRLLLAAQPDLTIVGEAAHGPEAVQAAAEIHPEVVLMDMESHHEEAIRTLRRIARPDSHPDTTGTDRTRRCPPRVLALIPLDLDECAYAVLRAGAGGYLLKNALPDELMASLRIVADGNAVISPRLTRELVNAVRHQAPERTPGGNGRLALLTEREREVLAALASGWSNREIAEGLSIAPTTVKTHISNILTKIGARARVQAVVFAYETGLVRPPWLQRQPQDAGFTAQPRPFLP
ncbi:LuxR C-terminal-related transcriptional regulator [Streptomyces sp. NPDC096311]|uniref:LuxR C-terminal-related transcriptional regulator n=1 Tax=Streptomyces sp. NPDC096311 TaxID=3366083 RepID=UPI00382E3DA6